MFSISQFFIFAFFFVACFAQSQPNPADINNVPADLPISSIRGQFKIIQTRDVPVPASEINNIPAEAAVSSFQGDMKVLQTRQVTNVPANAINNVPAEAAVSSVNGQLKVLQQRDDHAAGDRFKELFGRSVPLRFRRRELS